MSKATRGEVWRVNLDPTIGAEISKIRPAVVLNPSNIGRLPLVIIVPITEWKPNYADYVWFTYSSATPENGLTKASGADAFQVKSLSEIRLVSQIGRVTESQLAPLPPPLLFAWDMNTLERSERSNPSAFTLQ